MIACHKKFSDFTRVLSCFFNFHEPNKGNVKLQNTDVMKNKSSFYHFSKYHMKIMLGDFNANLEREDIFKPTIGNQSLHQDSNANGVRIATFAT